MPVTAALLAKQGFGGPDRIFDGGHNVLQAFSRSASSEPLVDELGERWDGVLELAIKPYPCVAFLHPALDALAYLIDEHQVQAGFTHGLLPSLSFSARCAAPHPSVYHTNSSISQAMCRSIPQQAAAAVVVDPLAVRDLHRRWQ